MIEGAVYHEGKVAVRYHQPIPKAISVNGTQYYCDVRYGVSVALVEEKDVPALLAVTGGCCGGKKFVFSLCGKEAYDVWSTGNR